MGRQKVVLRLEMKILPISTSFQRIFFRQHKPFLFIISAGWKLLFVVSIYCTLYLVFGFLRAGIQLFSLGVLFSGQCFL